MQRDESRGPRPDLERVSGAGDDRTGTDYSGRGTEGFTGGGRVGNRPQFSGRPSLTEERQDMARDPGQAASEDLDDAGRNS